MHATHLHNFVRPDAIHRVFQTVEFSALSRPSKCKSTVLWENYAYFLNVYSKYASHKLTSLIFFSLFTFKIRTLRKDVALLSTVFYGMPVSVLFSCHKLNRTPAFEYNVSRIFLIFQSSRLSFWIKVCKITQLTVGSNIELNYVGGGRWVVLCKKKVYNAIAQLNAMLVKYHIQHLSKTK